MPEAPIDRLVFVFNADAGLVNAMFDSVRKALRMESCTLCALTHGLAGERTEWCAAKADLGVPVDYLHRDELAGDVGRAASKGLPCVLVVRSGATDRLIEPDELDRLGGDYAAFERLLRDRIDSYRSGLSLPL